MGFITGGGSAASSDLEGKVNKNTADIAQLKTTVVNISTATLNQIMANNTEYRCGEMSNIDITLTQTEQYESALTFSSGETATELVYDDSIYWSGTDVIEVGGKSAFVPAANMRYNVFFWYDGLVTNAIVRGVDYDIAL